MATKAWRERVKAEGGAGRHGTPYCAVTGCKRRECLDARNVYLREWRASRKKAAPRKTVPRKTVAKKTVAKKTVPRKVKAKAK
jgi:hypothetical protein